MSELRVREGSRTWGRGEMRYRVKMIESRIEMERKEKRGKMFLG